jgi:glycosyltransferase involved in cell wall biosynthesis
MLKVGVVDVTEREGGRKTFVDNFFMALREEGYRVHLVDLDRVSLSMLNSFDVLHFSTHFLGKQMWKLLLSSHPKKVLTIHGWVKKERLFAPRYADIDLRTSVQEILYSFLSLVFLRIAPFLFDAITCPSKDTAEENGLKNVTIISNAIFPEYFDNIDKIEVRKQSNQILFVTYVSIGGLKNAAIVRTVEVVEKLNGILKSGKVVLLIFGKDYSETRKSPYISFMGFSSKFLGILRSSDLFITGKTFPDLGYAEMEAGILGIPVAKFTENYENEELVDGRTGILSRDVDEMVAKLFGYVSDLESNKNVLGSNFRNYVYGNKSWSSVIVKWNKLFMEVCQVAGGQVGNRWRKR